MQIESVLLGQLVGALLVRVVRCGKPVAAARSDEERMTARDVDRGDVA